ncbi:hypothetical protein M409DRAFT_16536 [Zasmidium cellare ATCC 36951]|uniref:Uncharacterized protein n=1 Tax=Zasmidium cellare ATCC 36951 TaxID=1080233 RepID=A0A6A6D7Q5_ZASCE|nr:uncharacterized protein M409DRAFT_16536 [Zasmidium cellare ATCC 36951]KAF2174272.1 hypothetical protein M409DRAFT_16536 [Zasmidium cellare ATCC 36951]
MTGKRPHDGGAEGGEELERKKQATAQKMEELKKRFAAKKPQNGGGNTNTAPPPQTLPVQAAPQAATTNGGDSTERKKAEAAKRIAEIKARVAAQKAGASPANGAAVAPPPPPPSEPSWRAEARQRAAAAARKKDSPAAPTPPQRVESRGPRGGLGIGLHPSLLNDTTGDKSKGPQGPKFSTTKGNQQPEKPKVNPYLAADEPVADESERSAFAPAARKQAERRSKALVFSEKGKYMAQANSLRNQARLEEMKRRIAAENRKTEIEEASDKAFLVPEPPSVEWWDEGLLPEGQDTYENWEEPGRNKIETEDTIVTALIQRPVLLTAPQDRFQPAPKPLMLTADEQAKLRRQRRMADMKEEQAKIRLGLVEPPPPKVKKSNMMRVLGEQAVKDPTAVEARVNREIAQRQHDHEQANLNRQLTKEERLEKLKRQQAEDEAKGLMVSVFRVDDLSCGKHRYQIDQNAKDSALTGIVVLNPTMNLIIVEGGVHSISHYKKLMLNRIQWTENIAPPANSNPTTFTNTTDGSNANITAGTRGVGSKAAQWCHPLDDNGDLKDLSGNRCVLVWEGLEGSRKFHRWGSRACETDGEARDILGKMRMENMWTLARSK